MTPGSGAGRETLGPTGHLGEVEVHGSGVGGAATGVHHGRPDLGEILTRGEAVRRHTVWTVLYGR